MLKNNDKNEVLDLKQIEKEETNETMNLSLDDVEISKLAKEINEDTMDKEQEEDILNEENLSSLDEENLEDNDFDELNDDYTDSYEKEDF